MNDNAADSAVAETVELGSLTIETGPEPSACVIWLHGLGADGADFAALPEQLALPPDCPTRFIFPDAPFRPVTINGGAVMRAWYDIDADISPAAPQDEAGVRASARMLEMMARQEIAAGIRPERVILAGFSQGGAVALYAGLQSTLGLGGVVALSTYLPLAKHFGQTLAPPPVFMAHGDADAVIPLSFAAASRERLVALGATVTWNTYPMPHAVCAAEITALRAWLLARLGASCA